MALTWYCEMRLRAARKAFKQGVKRRGLIDDAGFLDAFAEAGAKFCAAEELQYPRGPPATQAKRVVYRQNQTGRCLQGRRQACRTSRLRISPWSWKRVAVIAAFDRTGRAAGIAALVFVAKCKQVREDAD